MAFSLLIGSKPCLAGLYVNGNSDDDDDDDGDYDDDDDGDDDDDDDDDFDCYQHARMPSVWRVVQSLTRN